MVDPKIRLFRFSTSMNGHIHLVRVPQDVDVPNVRWKQAKWGERPAFLSVHVDSYATSTQMSKKNGEGTN